VAKPADEHLALAADVPELHLEGRGQRDADAQQHDRVAHGGHKAVKGFEGAVPHDLVHRRGIQARDGIYERRVHQQRQQHGDQPHAPGAPERQVVALGDAYQRLARALLYPLFRFFTVHRRRPPS
jgi:hypothetical protein